MPSRYVGRPRAKVRSRSGPEGGYLGILHSGPSVVERITIPAGPDEDPLGTL